jgi:hypothetical protein
MIPTSRHSEVPAEHGQPMPEPADSARGIRGALRSLFPAVPATVLPTAWGLRVMATAAQVLAVVCGAVVLLLRVPGPAWDTIYAEDYFLYLPGALQHPWHLFAGFDGYEQLVPRIIAQCVTFLPFADVAKGFAFSGALIAACCALFIFHASAGHIRSVWLRLLLAVAVVALPSAPMEMADSGVNTIWYLLLALFWAVLWCPRTRTGITVAALVGFFTAASTSIVILFAPLLAIRVFLLRRVRDNAVTAGWLAGCLIQLGFVVESVISGESRLVGGGGPPFGRNNRLGNSLTFYAHDVVLRSVGWHLSWWLQSRTTTDWATLIVGVALAVVLGAIAAIQPGTRPFIILAVATGFIFCVFSVFLDPWDTHFPVTLRNEVAARYTALPILLIEAALIIGADWALRGRRHTRLRDDTGPRQATGQRHALLALRPALAVTLLVAFLAAGWVTDFRYIGIRSGPGVPRWSPVAAQWRHDCEVSRTGEIDVMTGDLHQTIPCDRLRF